MTQLIDGRYEVIQSLSAGGFGITFLAKDLRRPGQPRCVVKQLRPQRDFDANTWQVARRLFDQEAAILERLGRHDQIPLLLAHLDENGNFYIVQDFIEGRTFRDELLDVQRLPEKEVITLLRQGLTVLSYVHQQGVIHRDIKPENLIRRQDGVLCLIDFGIVKEFSAQNLSRMASPQAGIVSTTISIGTPGYISQEQTNGKPCPASDVYALGKVAIEALTGTFPTELDTDPNTAELVWQRGLQINPALAKVLTTMVRHHHSRRYANGQAALQALETALAPPVPTVVVSPKAPEPKPPLKSKKQGWLQGLLGLSGAPQPAPQPQAQRQPQAPKPAPQRQPQAPIPQPAAQDDLRSEKGIDYTRLRDLLKAGQWREADRETYEVMIRAVGKQSGDYFTRKELLNFPCTDLRTIDRLWVTYSQGQFGFSVQKRIYVECGAKLDGKYPGDTIWREFGNRVGWRKGGLWVDYKDLKANPSFSPAGEFPTGWRISVVGVALLSHRLL
jgi:serine/threonine protein kinase